MSGARAAAELAEALGARGLGGARIAVVLGSGLGGFADALEERRVARFDELPVMPASGVPGHGGRFVAGTVGGERVLVQQGRVHLYEGWSAADVTRAVRAMARLGVRALVLTNAAGGVHAERAVPHWMRVRDHLNLQGRTPLAPAEAGRGSPYDEALGAALVDAARSAAVTLHEGVYAGVLGPSYETPAEIRMLARFGADAVGMSTVAEALAAHAAGVRVCALSCVTNHAAGIAPRPLAHAEVVAAAALVARELEALLAAAVPRLARALER